MLSFLFGLSLFTSDAQADAFEARKMDDPAASRGLILPSSETLNKGQFTLSSIELFFFNASYGVSDNAMVSFTSLIPLVPGTPFFGLLSGKFKVLSKPRFTFSLQPNTLLLPAGTGGGTIGLQFISDIALTDSGSWILTLAANPQFVYVDIEDAFELSQGVAGLLGVAIQGQLHKRVKFMGEIFLPGAFAFETGETTIVSEALLLNAGFRFPGKNVSFDVSFIRPLQGGAYLGFPFVTATGRFN